MLSIRNYRAGFCAMQVAEKGPVGLTQHPHRNLLATWSTEGALKLWKA